MEHTKTSPILVVQVFLNTIGLSLHDPTDGKELSGVCMLSRNKQNVKRAGKHFSQDPAESRHVLAVVPLLHSGSTLCGCTLVPEPITLNEEYKATQEPQQKNVSQSFGTQRTKKVVPTTLGTATMQSGSWETKAPAPRNQSFSCATLQRRTADIKKAWRPFDDPIPGVRPIGTEKDSALRDDTDIAQ